ncbi:HAMP domain-containing sensor histidine kinase [Emticicia sp. 21SJ11W-3]|uniref:HAMP domain-containing sensor histidine kinase n=1 Tax=Emticicia sp. 21SJ11W-3 TaxID=2916755 RepID=UPI00209DF6C8|nr:HAMP domain-containing sensor histidine kinase [Emticicia sp. 21SJ11W-3]UTA68743.1 HAMP domain-containing histidine kinase [Emticicia sp. 21SJ11W-3]
MKTQTKIAFSLVLFNSFILLSFSIGIYFFLNEYSYIDFYKRLETRASIGAKYNLKIDSANAETFKKIRDQHLEKLEAEREYILKVSAKTDFEQLSEAHQVPVSLLKNIMKEGRARYQEGNVFYSGIKFKHENATYIVIVSANNRFVSHHLKFLRNILLWGILFTVVVTVYLSVYFSKHFFDPIKEMIDKVKQISTENIHLRLKEPENNNEISELASTFNDLLNRIETAFETQKNFISNASHELATPLTAIIGEADVALIKERKPEEYQKVLQNVLQQAERLNEITRSLLFLAQTGYKGKNVAFEIVRLDEVVWEVKALIDRLNPENKIMLDLSLLPEDHKKLKVSGNKQLLHLALANLLNNACKYSHNKPVSVHIGSSQEQVMLFIKDQGIGIPESDLPFIYDPFFRASNTHLFEGFGIGLPLARNIIKLHNGTLVLTSKAGSGTSVQISFPLARLVK